MVDNRVSTRPLLNARRAVAALSAGHGVNDFYMGFLPALLPVLADRLHLSFGLVGSLVTLVTLWTHITQPAIGYGADRIGRRYLVVLGPVITGLAMSCLGLVDSYQGLLLALVIGSLGNALFHPVGASLTGTISRGRGPAMAIFSAGGNVGYGLGSLLIVLLVARFGLSVTWTMAAFGLLAAVYSWTSLPRAVEATRTPDPETAPRTFAWLFPLLVLFLVVLLRAAEGTVITTFVPLLFHARGEGLQVGGYALLSYCLAGAAGGLLAGPACVRLGAKWVTILSMAITAPALYLFLHASGVTAAILFWVGSAALFAALPVNLAMAQRLLPRHASTASGVMMGLAWGIGAFSTKFVGQAADRLTVSLGPALGLQRALEYSLLMVLAAAVIGLLLPGEKQGPPEPCRTARTKPWPARYRMAPPSTSRCAARLPRVQLQRLAQRRGPRRLLVLAPSVPDPGRTPSVRRRAWCCFATAPPAPSVPSRPHLPVPASLAPKPGR